MESEASAYYTSSWGYTRPGLETSLVSIKGVNYAFGSGESLKQVLFDNHLEVYPGEIVIMTGPSGSGKTTLLTLIGALRALQNGSLKAFGQELSGLDDRSLIAIRRSIGFIFQQHNLFESLTAFQNVKLAAEVSGRSQRLCRQMTEEVLVRLGLGNRMRYKPHNLSGGQRQRVAIARALVHQPKLVLADEPTAALDKDTGREVVKLFQQLAEQLGSSVLIVTHDNRILDVAHRIVNMIDGHIVSDVNIAQSLQDASFLRKCPAFANTSPYFLAEAAGHMLTERYPAGMEVIAQGDVGDKFYVIRSGKVEIIKTVDGVTHNMGQLGPGDFFGELALLDDKPRAATIRTVEPSELASLGKTYFTHLVKSSRDFKEQLRKTYFYR